MRSVAAVLIGCGALTMLAPPSRAKAQAYYRAPTAAESVKLEFDSLFARIVLDADVAERAKAVIRRYELDRRSMRPPEERARVVGDSLKTARDSALRALLTNKADSLQFESNLSRRHRVPMVLPPPPESQIHPETFTSIASIRELSNGDVLVADGRERRLVRLRFPQRSTVTIGRVGKGPGEFLWLGKLRVFGADSTLFDDGGNRRWTVLRKDSIVDALPPDHPLLRRWSPVLSGADLQGNVMLLPRSLSNAPDTRGPLADSSPVVVASTKSSMFSVVTTLKRQPVHMEGAPDGRASAGFTETPVGTVLGMSEDEGALMFSDGWIAVARVQPFRIDVRDPKGHWTRGDSLPIPRIRVDATERKAYLDRNRKNYEATGIQPPRASDFPAFLPPFVSPLFSLLPAPDGSLFVQQSRSAHATGNRYWIVGRDTRLVGELRLPDDMRIVGSGDRSLYVSVRDTDDLLRLARYPWPLSSAKVLDR